MIEAFLIYLYLVLHNVATVCGFALFAVPALILFYFVASDADVGDIEKTLRAIATPYIFAALFVLLFPTKENLAYIIGGAAVWNTVVNVEGVADLPPNVVKAANRFLEGVYAEEDEASSNQAQE